METGHRPRSHQLPVPSAKHLAWAILVGTVLVISGLRESTPPQPSAAQALTPVVRPYPGHTGPAVAHAARLPGLLSPQAYFDPPGMVPVRPGPAGPTAAGPSMARAYTAPLGPAPGPAATAPASTGPAPAASRPSASASAAPRAVRPMAPSDPMRLRIPVIGVDALMTELDLDAAGALRPPPADNPVLAGWYGDGTAPGSVGTAITAGHVDTPVGPGVFHDLGAVTKGAHIEILRADRRTAVFTVDAVEVYDKQDFPDKKVYGASERPELRVITCGGGYSAKSGYRSNVVVYATLTAVRQPAGLSPPP